MMENQAYLAFIHGVPGDYGISFPDFPGCISAADTMIDVLAMGEEALTFHIEGMMEDGQAIPRPGTRQQIEASGEFSEELANDGPMAWGLIRVPVPDARIVEAAE